MMLVHSLRQVLALAIFALYCYAASIPEDVGLALVGRDTLIIIPDGSVAPDWKYIGCYNDSIYSRDLEPKIYKTDAMTQELCVQYCVTAGFWYAGVEYGRECYCGDILRTFGGYQGILQTESQCNMPCSGNTNEKCGGKSLLNVFTNGRKATINPGVNGFTRIGCKYDAGGNYRTLTTPANLPTNNMTVAACTSACAAANFAFAGIELGKECWCGNSLLQGTDTWEGPAYQDSCDLPCTGNQSEWCGGTNYLNVYKRPFTLPKIPPLPPGWYPRECLIDDPSSRTLLKLLPLPQNTMTIEGCINACAQRGYIYAGMEYGQECWCGNTPTPLGSSYLAECNMACRGNTAETCGGRGALNLYKYANQSAVNQLRNSGFEEGSAGGATYWAAETYYYPQGNLSAIVETDSGNALAGHRNALLWETGFGDTGHRSECFIQYIPYLDPGYYNLTFFVGRAHTPTPSSTGTQQGEYYDTIQYTVSIGGGYDPPGSPSVCAPPSSCLYKTVSGSKLAGYDKVTHYLYSGGYNRKVQICGHYFDTRKSPQDSMLLDEVTLIGPL